MSERLSLRLIEPVQAHKAMATAWAHCKPWLIAGHKLVLDIRKETRSSEQNAKFHALCSDIARAGTQWAGKPRNAAQWKVLLVSGQLSRQKRVAIWCLELRANLSIYASQQRA